MHDVHATRLSYTMKKFAVVHVAAARDYDIGEVLGTGSFATVKKVTRRKDGTE